MADAGLPVCVPRKIAGHGSLTTAQRYLHPDRQSTRTRAPPLSAFVKARRSPVVTSYARSSARTPTAIDHSKRPLTRAYALVSAAFSCPVGTEAFATGRETNQHLIGNLASHGDDWSFTALPAHHNEHEDTTGC
jgi:hypothetical protein